MYVALLMEIGLSYEEIGQTTYKEQENLIMGKSKLNDMRNKEN